jgi:predicted GH43/DUF377 family glycosyl hydrolase
MRLILGTLLVCGCFFFLCCESSPQQNSRESEVMDIERLDQWSAFFRGWQYHPEVVVSPSLEPDLGFTMVDGPNVYWHQGEWHMLYFGYDGKGYQACRAVSHDLLYWGPRGLVMGYGEPGAFDYGGVVLVGPLYDTHDLHTAPQLRLWRERYWILYGCYPEQGGYELGNGAQGLAWSEDGLEWQRFSKERPILSIGGAAEWENRVIYSPCVIAHEDSFWSFYNAKGKGGREQIGLVTSSDLVHWNRHEGNPVVRNNPDGYDALLAANPDIYRDGDHWVMLYFGASRNNPDGKVHAHTLAAFSTDLVNWTSHPEPILTAGGHPDGLDSVHAHNTSLVYNKSNDTYYMFYCAVGAKGRVICLVTNKSLD